MSVQQDINKIQSDLSKLACEQSASEVHGSLCGILCAKHSITIYEWLMLTLLADAGQNVQDIKARDLLLEAIGESFKNFFITTITSLADNNLNFNLLLPEQGSAAARLEAIAQWAQGFLLGLNLAGVTSFTDYPDEVTEFIEAMAAISTAGDYDLAGDDSDEAAIVEFIEFIRMGVLFINEEMNPVRLPVDIPGAVAASFSERKKIH